MNEKHGEMLSGCISMGLKVFCISVTNLIVLTLLVLNGISSTVFWLR